MKLFKCNHKWIIKDRSNVLQQDDMGYPLRLCICTCTKCGKTEHQWLDAAEEELKELKTGKSFLVRWKSYCKKENVDDYKEDNYMPFHEAMRILFEDGDMLRRKCWPDGEFIFINATMKTIFMNTEKKYIRYKPSRSDMFAMDWEIAR